MKVVQSNAGSQSAAREQLLERARALVPALRERAQRCEELRRLPDETIRDLHRSGLFRMLQPRRVGGAELDYTILIDACAEVSRGCGSTGWVLGNLAAHHWMLAMWPKAAQDEVWNVSPDELIGSSVVFPSGSALRVDGGYRLSGRWPFSSGIDPCTWNMLGGIVHGEDPETHEYRLFLLPRADYQVIDTWRAAGLRGTGSHDVTANDVFVPEHRTIAVEDTKGGPTPGAEANPSALYRIPLFATFPYMLSGVALGIAQGTLELFTESLTHRVTRYSGRVASDFTTVQMHIAESSACIDAARLIMRANCDQVQRTAEARQVPDMMTKARYRRDGAFSTELCVRAVDTLFVASGGGGLYEANPIQRAFRDVHAAAAHISMIWDAAATTYGRVALGLSSDNPTL
ncbi:MAG TPA: acyl-CoA dehydrogenase family protein [Burkholderiales bacterium]|nr:acyl-CoA dehydrogenase family protein [Burkholderiales bacterium]